MEPAAGARMEDLREADFPGLHRYGPTGGMPALVEALAARARERSGLAVERGQVLVTAGATSGLACAVGALCDPGEEVLICAPFWPLIRGIVRAASAVPVEVPFFDASRRPPRPSPRSMRARARAPSRSTSRTRRTRPAACSGATSWRRS